MTSNPRSLESARRRPALAVPDRMAGFSLVELMVAMVAGLLIILALMSLWITVSRSNTEMTRSNRMVENGRFALQVLSNDLMHAGFWGGFIPTFDDLSVDTTPADAPTAAPDVCLADSSWTDAHRSNLIAMPVQTYATGTTTVSNTPTGTTCDDVNGLFKKSSPTVSVQATVQPNSDILVVRYADTCVPGQPGCAADTSGASNPDVYLQASRCTGEITAGNRRVLYSTASGTTPTFALTNRDCTTVAEKRRFVSNLYFVRKYASTLSSGAPADSIPTLVRSRFLAAGAPATHQPAEALIEGVEALRVELGFDLTGKAAASPDNDFDPTLALVWVDDKIRNTPKHRGDGVPDGSYQRCVAPGTAPCTNTALASVVAVRIHVLVRGDEQSADHVDTKSYCLGSTNADGTCPASNRLGPFNDRYRRQVFSTTVRLHNVSGRRETPP